MIFEERPVDTETVIERGEALAVEILALASALGDLTDRLVAAHESAKSDRGGDTGHET